jgi:hypothetical protein
MGQKPSTLETCYKRGINITVANCKIEFDSSDNVVSFAGVGEGEFEADPDIAGEGVSKLPSLRGPSPALLLTTRDADLRCLHISQCCSVCLGHHTGVHALVAVGAMSGQEVSPSHGFTVGIKSFLTLVIFSSHQELYIRSTKGSNKIHSVVDDFILSCADTQLLLILAVGGSFYSTTQCNISLYHYYVAVHMVLLGLTTSILAFILVRSPYKSFLSALARIVIFGISIGTLIRSTKMTESDFTDVPAVQSKLPNKGQWDSLIIAPAYCILENSVNPFFNLTESQQDHLTHTGLTRDVKKQCIALLAASVITLIATSSELVVNYRRGVERSPQQPGTRHTPSAVHEMGTSWFAVFRVIKAVIWIISVVLIIMNWITIITLRRWVDKSKWLDSEGGNPEKDVRGVGQLAPLVALGVAGFTFLNGVWSYIGRCRCFKYVYVKEEEDGKSSRRNSVELNHGNYARVA